MAIILVHYIIIYTSVKLKSLFWIDISSRTCHTSMTVNKAFQFTSITSVTLLDCWTIAWAILLTWIFLGTKYSVGQYFGAAICIGGLGLVLFSDSGGGGEGKF